MADESEAKKSATKIEADNLSQLIARILNQLALSAWLPSAFLVLMFVYVLVLGQVVSSNPLPSEAIPKAILTIGYIKFPAVLLILASIVVLTMVTQAFTFEAIRVLEGYWGTSRIALRWSRMRCARYRRVKVRLEGRLSELNLRVWPIVEMRMRDERRVQQELKMVPYLTESMILSTRRQVTGEDIEVDISEDDQKVARAIDWISHIPADDRRLKELLENRLLDFPASDEMQPTKLGNILRHFENDTGESSVESMVETVFDELPFSLQVAHDEQRGRLDLYCSMVFVWGLLVVVSLFQFNWTHWEYAIGAIAVGLVGIWLTYRATLASARHYGELLLQVQDHRVGLQARIAAATNLVGTQERGLGLVPALARGARYLFH